MNERFYLINEGVRMWTFTFIYNTPPWMSTRENCASLKPLLGKALWDKNLMKEKEYTISYYKLPR